MPSWYAEQRNAQARKGRERRRNAWIALGLAVFAYMAVWGAKGLLG